MHNKDTLKNLFSLVGLISDTCISLHVSSNIKLQVDVVQMKLEVLHHLVQLLVLVFNKAKQDMSVLWFLKQQVDALCQLVFVKLPKYFKRNEKAES